jgi:PAS domain S-box-containing protein
MTDLHSQEIRWFGTCTDIEHQMQNEATIRKSESKFRTLADAIPQIVWTANPDGQIDFFNHRWFEYTGLTLEQSQREGWQLLIHPDDLDKYMREWRKALMTGDTYEMEFRLKRAVGLGNSKGNPYRWHLGRAVALRGSDGGVVKWFATWTEIEAQKRNEDKKR